VGESCAEWGADAWTAKWPHNKQLHRPAWDTVALRFAWKKTLSRFCRGLPTQPKIATLMAARGFEEQDRKEGWLLLDQATGRDRDFVLLAGTGSPRKELVALVDGWENTWFDVADAALSRLCPRCTRSCF